MAEKTKQTKKHPGAVSMGRRRMELLSPEERQALASKGGKRRLGMLSKADRQALGKKAAEARWGKKTK
jgi:hypothetical protein